ncbi:MAG: stressosome-associated protein Prli42 [Gorillibacterium sp.]|nr:stressosome-associated protein Prli42 [Gorillibacterium sp.]
MNKNKFVFRVVLWLMIGSMLLSTLLLAFSSFLQ